MPQETKTAYDTGRSSAQTLRGLLASSADEPALLDALERAFDYRGDVTIERTGGGRAEGYVYDRKRGGTLAGSTLRLMDKEGARHTIGFDEIATIEFTGKDTAAGKSFEKWIERYIEKKRSGESASIESESLD